MKINWFIKVLLIVAGSMSVSMISSGFESREGNGKAIHANRNTPNKKKPNILFIMADQHRFDALSIAGNPVVRTPNIDKIAQNGVYFETAYTHIPVCVPSRSSFLTGCTIDNTKIRKNSDVSALREQGAIPMKTFGEILVEKGYYNEYNGKWHVPQFKFALYKVVGLETPKGIFKDYDKFLDSFVPKRKAKEGEQIDKTYNRPYKPDPIDRRFGLKPNENPVDEKGNPYIMHQPDDHGELLIPAEYTKVAFDAKTTIQSLKRAKENGDPFCIICSFGPPHSPILPTKPYYGMYDPETIPIPESINDPMINTPYTNTNRRLSMPEYGDKEKIRYMMSNYYGMITEVDNWVGQIIQTLKEIGEYENTLIIYTSDHGEMLGAHGMREKNNFYEESVHVPLVMSFPDKIKAGTVVSDPVSLLDLFPTIMDYLEAGKYKSDGEDLRPLIEGKSKRKYTVSQWNVAPDYCVRTGDWKLIYSKSEGTIDCLYNLKEDPYEMNNLIGKNPERMKYEKQVEILKSYLVEFLGKTNSRYVDAIKNKPAIPQ